jgi:hypothetical protein
MKNKARVVLLAATFLAVVSLHVEWTKSDNGSLLVVDHQEIDFFGIVHHQWNRITRNCHSVTRLAPIQEKYQIAQSLIEDYSPPHSMSAKITSASSADAWTLVEVEFTDLLPAVVLIHAKGNQSFIVPHAVWSGYTKPWKSAPLIRKYILKNGNGVPPALLDCFDPQSQSFQ